MWRRGGIPLIYVPASGAWRRVFGNNWMELSRLSFRMLEGGHLERPIARLFEDLLQPQGGEGAFWGKKWPREPVSTVERRGNMLFRFQDSMRGSSKSRMWLILLRNLVVTDSGLQTRDADGVMRLQRCSNEPTGQVAAKKGN
jgi:hypothetical protein